MTTPYRTAVAVLVLVSGACTANSATTTTKTDLVEVISQEYIAVEQAVTFCFIAEMGEQPPSEVLDSTMGRMVEEMEKQEWDEDSPEGKLILELAHEVMTERCPALYVIALAATDTVPSLWDEDYLEVLADERVGKFCALVEGWGEPPDEVLEEVVEDLAYVVRDWPVRKAERLMDLFAEGIFLKCPDAALAATR